jgi:hypothetical protein
MICEPIWTSSSGVIAFTVACVPTGMKIGVSILPCVVVREPKRAAEPGSFLINSNFRAGKNGPYFKI